MAGVGDGGVASSSSGENAQTAHCVAAEELMSVQVGQGHSPSMEKVRRHMARQDMTIEVVQVCMLKFMGTTVYKIRVRVGCRESFAVSSR